MSAVCFYVLQRAIKNLPIVLNGDQMDMLG